jgi:hypothetical protein
MVGFAFVRKDSGNVDYIISWANVTELPENYPYDANTYEVVKIEDYKGDFNNYECCNLADKTFNKRLIVTADKTRTLAGGTVNITVTYPDAANETAHLSIDDTIVQDVLAVNGSANISTGLTVVGFNKITVTSTTHYGINSISVEVLS